MRTGDKIKQGQVLAIVEAMKLMNDIESEYEGEIAEIYVEKWTERRVWSAIISDYIDTGGLR